MAPFTTLAPSPPFNLVQTYSPGMSLCYHHDLYVLTHHPSQIHINDGNLHDGRTGSDKAYHAEGRGSRQSCTGDACGYLCVKILSYTSLF
jgi:hypothetical protein